MAFCLCSHVKILTVCCFQLVYSLAVTSLVHRQDEKRGAYDLRS